MMETWSANEARNYYNFPHWGAGYFDVGPDGQVVVSPSGDGAQGIVNLHKLAGELRQAGLKLPVLVRFTDILTSQVARLRHAFQSAMEDCGYQGRYTPVYPIKVNQQRTVIEWLQAAGESAAGSATLGLEAGSKPELLVVLALAPKGGTVVCNGYKDREFVRLALMGQQLGLRVFLVVEKLSELALILEESARLGVVPMIGVRIRLAAAGAGKWQNTGGEKSKFGLSPAQVLSLIDVLRGRSMLHALRLVHFHLGSQIPNIHYIKAGMAECARYYAELRKLGAAIEVVDVGGGLGVDYEGNRSRTFCSVNYSIEEYGRDVVSALHVLCAREGLPHPEIISESGRALTAHHAVLIADIIDHEPAPGEMPPAELGESPSPVLRHLAESLQSTAKKSTMEAYHDAAFYLQEAQTLFNNGLLSLAERALAEDYYVHICRKVLATLANNSSITHREVLDELRERMVDKFFCNFSLFQSLPDSWAIDQIFPIVPLQRLGEKPTRNARLEDITCDSDGRIDHYVTHEGILSSLPLHLPKAGEEYFLGVFLVGAYQEILGDMHNLFGDTDSVNVVLDGDGGYRILLPKRGDTVASVLKHVGFDADHLLSTYREKIVSKRDLTPAQQAMFVAWVEEGVRSYTYLEH